MNFIFLQLLAALVSVALLFPATVDSKTIPAHRSTVTYDYDAFGNLIHSTGTTPNNYLFVGEQFDPDLGLYYNRARYLNTSTGRFWTMDTEEGDDNDPLSLHKYFYTEGDPVDGVDPTGNDDLATITAGFSVSETLDAMPQIQTPLRPQPIELKFKTVLDDPPHHLWEVEWGLTHKTVRGGWIVQHLRIDVPRSGRINAASRRHYNYWEAWQVLIQSRKTTTLPVFGYDDMFRGPAGTTFNAETRFYEGLALPASFVPDNPSTAAGILPSTTVDPNLPTTNATPPNNRWWVAP